MKKIICLILSLVILSITSISTQAQVTDDKLLEEFTAYCKDNINLNNPSSFENYSVRIHVRNDVEGVTYFIGDCQSLIMNMGYSEFIDGWYFESSIIRPPSGLGLFVRTDEGIWDLKEAYEQGIITDLSPTLSLTDEVYFTIIENGDANGDYAVDIKDSTAIQKHLAGLDVNLVDKNKREEILDTDRDGSITVRDATVIQKRIAGLVV